MKPNRKWSGLGFLGGIYGIEESNAPLPHYVIPGNYKLTKRRRKMKYFCLWEMDMSKMPTDPKEKAAAMMKMIEMTKEGQKTHPGWEWGNFVGENKGYATATGDAKELMKSTLAFSPYVQFKVYQAASIGEFEEAFKSFMSTMQPK